MHVQHCCVALLLASHFWHPCEQVRAAVLNTWVMPLLHMSSGAVVLLDLEIWSLGLTLAQFVAKLGLNIYCRQSSTLYQHFITHLISVCVEYRGEQINPNIDSIDTKVSMGIGSILVQWDWYFCCSLSSISCWTYRRDLIMLNIIVLFD